MKKLLNEKKNKKVVIRLRPNNFTALSDGYEELYLMCSPMEVDRRFGRTSLPFSGSMSQPSKKPA
jgi:hypothetical protein